MVLKVQKKDRETSQNLIRRFTSAVRQSGILTEVKRKRFWRRKISGQKKKESAIRKEQFKREYEKLKKLGKIGTPRIKR